MVCFLSNICFLCCSEPVGNLYMVSFRDFHFLKPSLTSPKSVDLTSNHMVCLVLGGAIYAILPIVCLWAAHGVLAACKISRKVYVQNAANFGAQNGYPMPWRPFWAVFGNPVFTPNPYLWPIFS